MFDCSTNQLRRDQLAAEKYGFDLKTAQGDMRDLNLFDKENVKIEGKQLLECGHSLEDIIGGRIEAGFAIIGFQESDWGLRLQVNADRKFPQYLAACAVKRAWS